jgi:cytochrome b subunit of formate dehydrogenase
MMRKLILKQFLFSLFLIFLFINSVHSQSNEDCLTCHEDNTLTMERKGKEVSLFIDPEKYENSPHEGIDCIECHVGFDPDEEPHAPNIKPVDCSPCHSASTKQFINSKHSKELICNSCHGDVHTEKNARSILQECSSCHEKAFSQYKMSIHYNSQNGAGCYNCHQPHKFQIAGTEDCLACHGKKEFIHENAIHKDEKFILNYTESIHGELIDCSDCHGSHKILPVDSSESRVNKINISTTCSQCHDVIAEQYQHSEHGIAFDSGFETAPTCTGCHGEHDIHRITDARSNVSRQHEVDVCLRCHLDSPDVRSRMTHTSGFIAGYEKSIHGRALVAGNLEAAVCSDCHGGHDELRTSNPRSKVNKFNIASTCGNCHEEVVKEFQKSIHSEALVQGTEDAPTCTDCHGEHSIIEPTDKASPVSPKNVSQKVCGPCHSSVKLTEKYGLSSNRFEAYNDSYHGLAVRFGSVEAANCASCHGIHKILPSSNPESSISKENLAKTCGQCHPGANENFAKGKVHITGKSTDDRLIYWITTIYLTLIIGTIGAMAFHNTLDWFKKLKMRYKERYEEISIYPMQRKTRLFLRMSLNERIQHIILIVSFFTLVITGFMLKFPDAWWVLLIRKIFGDSVFELRGILHRIAAVVMVADTLYHLYYIIFNTRGRQLVKDLMFRYQDLKDMIDVLRYNFGISKIKPKFGRFSYIEKSEYWALVWGTIVMTVTGIALWFENQFLGWFSKLFVDVCETIHYYEAWLAFLAIIVWHIYFVIFNPDTYPMNFAWLTGKITEEEMEHEHPLELEAIEAKEQELEQKKNEKES